MAGTTYGISFSRKLREQGDYAEALAAAERDRAREPDNPEPVYDRAATLYCLGRFAEAVEDFTEAIALEHAADIMEPGVLDDDLFETLRKWAEAEPTRAREILSRYRELMPDGSHQSDVGKWILHIESAPRAR